MRVTEFFPSLIQLHAYGWPKSLKSRERIRQRSSRNILPMEGLSCKLKGVIFGVAYKEIGV